MAEGEWFTQVKPQKNISLICKFQLIRITLKNFFLMFKFINNSEQHKLVRFLLVAILNSCFNVCLLLILLIFLGQNSLTYSYIVASTITTLLAYLLNKFYVFSSKSSVFLRFLIVEVFFILLTVFLFEALLLILNLNTLPSIALLYSLRLILSFIFYKNFVFK